MTELLLFGSLVAVAFVVYDTVGNFFGYWTTFIQVTPVYPNFFGSDFTLIPLYAMLIYQCTSSWKSYFTIYIVYSVLFIFGYYYFVLQNIDAFDYLKPNAVIIDFILFSIVGIVARAIMIKLFKWEVKKGNVSAKQELSKLIVNSKTPPSK